MDIPCYFRIKYRNEVRIVDLPWDKLCFDSFKDKFIETFNIKITDGSSKILILTDNTGAPIPMKKFADIVKTFHNGSLFYVNVQYESTCMIGTSTLVTPLILENFFWKRNAGELLSLRNKEEISESERRKLVNELVDFMLQTFGIEVNKNQKEMTAKASIILFPSLKYKLSAEGTDLLLGPSGFFNRRLNYIKDLKRKNSSKASEVNTSTFSEEETSEHDDLQFLKNADIDGINWNIVIKKLNSSRKLRQQMLLEKQTDLREHFPFFFSHPKVLLADYEEQFKESNPKAFLEQWPIYELKLREICNQKYECVKHTAWPDEIENILLLLKLFPSKTGNVESFYKSIEKLIVFCVIGTAPTAMIKRENEYPYIIAYGPSRDNIFCFYIEVEKVIISLPKDFGWINAFDFLFKMHKTLQLKYDPLTLNAMNFIQSMIYGISDGQKKASNQMKAIFNRMQ